MAIKKFPISQERLEEIIKEYPTPFHIYDEKAIRANLRRFKKAFDWAPEFREYFAVKATPNPRILQIMQEEGAGADCSSLPELLLADASGIHGEKIMLTSNDTPADEFQKAIELGAIINLDDETKEYKLLVTIGLTEFCAIEYISESLDKLEVILKERFDNLLGDISHFNREHISSIIEDKAIMDWEYIDNLPKEIDGFKLFINPKEPVKIINGSYIIIDYCDFSKESNFIIYYNVFRDEFFGEARLHRIPEVTYEYDCSELKDLESLLAKNLQATLHKIRERI